MSPRLSSEVENADDPEAEVNAINVECYAQSEAATISQNANADPAALLGFLDRFIGVAGDLREEEELRAKLLESEADLKKAAEIVARIPGVERDLALKKSQLAALEKQNGKEVIALIRKLESEKQLRISLRNDVKSLLEHAKHDTLKEYAENIETLADPAELTVGSAEYVAIAKEASAFKAKVVASEMSHHRSPEVAGETLDCPLSRSLLAAVDWMNRTDRGAQ